MMELTNLNDNRNRKSLKIDEVTNERKNHWSVTLTTGDFPAFFENTNERGRRADFSVISGDNFDISENPNSFIIPLQLVATARVDDQTICYYQQKSDTQDSAIFQAKVSASITLGGDQEPVENPHLLMTFSVENKDDQENLQVDQQTYQGSGDNKSATFVNTSLGENSNGGKNIPMDQLNRDLVPEDRVLTT